VVSGRVVGVDGKPAAGADVALFGRVRPAPRGAYFPKALKVIAQGKADRDGKFRLAADGLTLSAYQYGFLIARAPGHGLGHHWAPIKPGPEVKVELQKERHDLRGRLVDLEGNAAVGVTVQVAEIVKLARVKDGPAAGTVFPAFSLDCEHAPTGLAYWPGPVVSDAQGRFTLRGLPAGYKIKLLAHGEKAARQYLEVPPGAVPAKELTLALTPGRILHGTVTYRDTGKPVPNARLRILSFSHDSEMDARADARGQFRVVPFNHDSYLVAAYPPAGEPYVLSSKEIRWPGG
jgi:hypothetical protein